MNIVVFVVDDEALLVANIVRVLRRHGHEVLAETDPKKALRFLLSDTEIDVIFLDLVMPDISGGLVYEELEKWAPARCARVVFFTGNAFMVEEWLKKTGRPVLEKPVELGLLERMVREFGNLDLPRGPHMPKDPSHPELPAMYDDDMEVNTGILKIAEAMGKKNSLPQHILDELRFRYLHSSHKQVKADVREIRKDVGELKSYKQDIQTTIKTSMKWVAGVVVVAGALYKVIEGVVTAMLHK